MKYLAISILMITLVFAQDNAECPCCSEEHQQFHFWIGEWNVYDTTGNILGTNIITLVQDKCLMVENWNSANSSFTGTSYNFYDNVDGAWNQTWVDNQGSNLDIKGKFIDGKMVLKSALRENDNGTKFYHQITWTPNEDGTVTQRWDVFDEQSKLLNTAFLGIYKKSN
jgi:hypothetical protein